MNVASVCTGIGAPEVAWAPLGWRPVLMAEIEAFPRAVLEQRHTARDARRQPHMTDAEHLAQGRPWPPMLWGDFTAIRERFLRRLTRRGRPRLSLADIDVLVGGTPCQAFSVAGLRRSLDDDRGNLSLAFVRLANAIDNARRRAGKPAVWVCWENVPGVLSTNDNAFGAVLGGLVGSGVALDPRGPRGRGRWTDAGVAHGPGRCAAWRVLDAQHFGLAQRRARVFVVARGYFGGAGQWDGPDALLPITESVSWHPQPRREAREELAGALAASLGGSCENDAANGRLAYCLNGGGMRRCDVESERMIPVVGPLLSGGNRTGGNRLPGSSADTIDQLIPVVFDETQITSVENRCNPRPGDPSHPLASGARPPTLAFHARQDPDSGEVRPPLDTHGGSIGVVQGMAVRSLTPRECERLQGFPDDYTAITVKGRPAKDGPRYKALGNSMAVPVMAWIGQRIAAVHGLRGAHDTQKHRHEDADMASART